MSIYVNHRLFLFLNPLLFCQKMIELPNCVMTYDKTKKPAFQLFVNDWNLKQI